jgi:serine/threonine protein phosphatase PrpC
MEFHNLSEFDDRQIRLYAATRNQTQHIDEVFTVEGLEFRVGGVSQPPMQSVHPGQNQDFILLARSWGSGGEGTGLPLFVVFDGVGSDRLASCASIVGALSMRRSYAHVGSVMDQGTADKIMDNALVDADKAVKSFSQRQNEDARTVIAAVRPYITPKREWRIAVGHAGDSRVIDFTSTGIAQLTLDHNGIPDWNAQLQFKLAQARSAADLTYDELQMFNRRHLIGSCLGSLVMPRFIRTVTSYPLTLEGDTVLCTDGIHDQLTYDAMSKVLTDPRTRLKQAKRAQILVQRAAKVHATERRQLKGWVFRGKPDDISIMDVRVSPV